MPLTTQCDTCGVTFRQANRKVRHCSKACGYKNRTPLQRISDDRIREAFELSKTMSVLKTSEATGIAIDTLARRFKKLGLRTGESWSGRGRSQNVFLPDDPAVRAYMAGLLDGEGTIYIERAKKRVVHVAIYNTHEPTMQWLASWGGSCTIRTRNGALGSRPIWIWQVAARQDCVHVLQALRPFLRIKAERADRALAALREVMRPYGNWTESGI